MTGKITTKINNTVKMIITKIQNGLNSVKNTSSKFKKWFLKLQRFEQFCIIITIGGYSLYGILFALGIPAYLLLFVQFPIYYALGAYGYKVFVSNGKAYDTKYEKYMEKKRMGELYFEKTKLIASYVLNEIDETRFNREAKKIDGEVLEMMVEL